MRTWLRWTGRLLAVVVGLLVIAVVSVYVIGRSKLQRTYALESPLTAIPADAASIERGRHVADIHGCSFCHGDDLGGKVFLDIPPGLIVASNLTSGKGGVGGRYSGVEWDRAVRFGVRHDRRGLLPFMPFALYGGLSDEDAAALAAYLEQLPPVDNELPPLEVRPIGYAMVAFTDSDRQRADPAAARTPRPAIEPNAVYGQYLAATICSECHGADLRGGKHPAPHAPPVPGLLHTAAWELPVFALAVRAGESPGGRVLSEWMPSRAYLHRLDDTEVAALHARVQELAANVVGGGGAQR